MNGEGLPTPDDIHEIRQTIEHLSQVEASLSALIQGQVDAYIDPATSSPRLLAEAQSSFLKGQRMLKQVHDAVACGIIVRDSSGVIVHANDLASRMLGTPLREMIGYRSPGARLSLVREDGSVIPLNELPSIIALETGKPVLGSILGVPLENDQSFRWLLVTAQPMVDLGDNQSKAVVTTLVDISQRVEAQSEALQNRQRIEAVLDLSPVGILVTDSSGYTVLANQEINRLSAMSAKPGNALDETFHSVTLKRPDGSPYPLERFPLERAIRDGESVLAEEVIIELPDGTVVPTLVNAVPVRSTEGKVSGGILVMQDISPLEEVDKLRTEFLAMVSHELRNPLSNIKGGAYVGLNSRQTLDSADASELFEMIYEEADRMRALVDDLLDITRIEAGLISLTSEPDSLEEILAEAKVVFSRSGHPHHLAINMPEHLPLVRVDRRRVLQVLGNLLDNAAKYSPPSSPISIETEGGADYITVHVRDKGMGVPISKLPLLFNKFSRLHTESGDTKPGVGLGLAICKGIIEAHGGRIWAESPGVNQGATFSFTLPVCTDLLSPVIDDGKISEIDVGALQKGATILIVDDEEHAILVLRRLLSEAGYRPVSTKDPSQAIQLIESNLPDLVLLDITFPDGNGFDIFREIRNRSNAAVVFLTASNQEEVIKRALQLGAADFITKPYSPERLLGCLETVLGSQNLRHH